MRRVYLHPVLHQVVGEIHPAPIARGDIESDKLLVFCKITLKRKNAVNSVKKVKERIYLCGDVASEKKPYQRRVDWTVDLERILGITAWRYRDY